MRVVFIEAEVGCAHMAPAQAEELEGRVADALAGRRGPLLLPPGRRVVVVELPEPAQAPAPAPARAAAPARGAKP